MRGRMKTNHPRAHLGSGRRGRRAHRAGGRVLGRAGELASIVHPRPRARLRPPPCQARDRRVLRRAALLVYAWFQTGVPSQSKNLFLVIPRSVISYWQAIILGLLQGVTELFPISSLGHSVILPKLLGWDIQQNDDYFITFLVATHLATAIVLFVFFWRDWKRILGGSAEAFVTAVSPRRHRCEARLAARRGHDSRRRARSAPRACAAQRLRFGTVGFVLPRPQRADAVRRRGLVGEHRRWKPTTTRVLRGR